MFEAIVQGLVQGLTEFLPVSSSGHLVLAQNLFHFQQLDPAFDVFVQGGTILSLLVYYFPRLRKLNLTPRYIFLLIAATIPAGLAGVLLQDQIESMFSSTSGIAFGFLLTTLCIGSTRFVKNKGKQIDLRDAVLIGLAQAAAIYPSLSRSGATISTALALGIAPAAAFDFSFLMSIPVMTGATLLSIRHLSWDPTIAPVYLTGFFTASLVGYLTLTLLSRVMRKGKFYLFAPYTLLLALLTWLLY